EAIGRSVTFENGVARLHPSAESQDLFRRIPDFHFAVRPLGDLAALAGSDPLLTSTFATAGADAEREKPLVFREVLPTAAGPVEIVMTRGEISSDDLVEWLGDL